MGAVLSALVALIWPSAPKKIVIVGLDNAGKTTTLYKLHLGEVVLTQPTIGSNVEEVVYKNIKFEARPAPSSSDGQPGGRLTPALPGVQCWDIGGQQTLRQSWSTYYKNTDAVIMMIDSTDRSRIGIIEACALSRLPFILYDGLRNQSLSPLARTQAELRKITESEELGQAVLLVFANKQARAWPPPAHLPRAAGPHPPQRSVAQPRATAVPAPPPARAGPSGRDDGGGDHRISGAASHQGPRLAHPAVLRPHWGGVVRRAWLDCAKGLRPADRRSRS